MAKPPQWTRKTEGEASFSLRLSRAERLGRRGQLRGGVPGAAVPAEERGGGGAGLCGAEAAGRGGQLSAARSGWGWGGVGWGGVGGDGGQVDRIWGSGRGGV